MERFYRSVMGNKSRYNFGVTRCSSEWAKDCAHVDSDKCEGCFKNKGKMTEYERKE